jgi:hypothetical protein
MGPAQASRLIIHGWPLEVYSDGRKIHLAQQIFSWWKLRHDRHRSLFPFVSPSPTTVFVFHLGSCAHSSNRYGHAADRMGINALCGS